MVKHLGVAVVGSGTDHVAGNTVQSALAEADMAHVVQALTSPDERLNDLNTACASRLDYEGGLPVILLGIMGGLGHLCRWRREVHAFGDKQVHTVKILVVDGTLEELATVYWEVDLVDNVLDHWDVNHDKVPTSHGYIFGLHHFLEAFHGTLAVFASHATE